LFVLGAMLFKPGLIRAVAVEILHKSSGGRGKVGIGPKSFSFWRKNFHENLKTKSFYHGIEMPEEKLMSMNLLRPLQKGVLFYSTLTLCFVLVACAHASRKDLVYQQGRKTVRFVKAQDVRHCEILANLIGETRSGETQEAKYDLLRRIARVGGNCGVVDGVVKQGKHIMAHGQGYRCR